MKLENEELELLLCPDDSEVNLRYASRRDGSILKIFNTKEKESTWLQATCDGMSVRGQRWRRKKEQEETCKKLTMRSTVFGG